MTEPVFFRRGPGLTIADIARIAGAKPDSTVNPAARIHNVAPIERAGPSDLTLFDKAGNENGARATQAGACLVTAGLAKLLPPGTARLTVDDPCVAFAAVTAALFPQASRPSSLFEVQGAAASAQVHPSARVEPGVNIDPAAVIGPRAEIGGGTFIGPMVVVGPDVRIGRECSIAASASITNALIGDRVVIHPGCRIGQEGGRGAAAALGRVIIQDGVEIGANCAIDRGGIGDTIIGEGAKIDNLVHIAHDVSVGRHCAVAAQSGLPDALMLDDHSRWPRDGRDGRAK